MTTRWIRLALIAGGLALACEARAQGPSCDGGGSMYPGPLKPQDAPPGPGGDLSLSNDIPNAFDPQCPKPRAGYCCNGMWFSAEALLGWFRDPGLPPVASAGGTGVVGAAGTTTVVVGADLDVNPLVGARASAGFWLNADRTMSIEATGFVTERGGGNVTLLSTAAQPAFIPFLTAANAEAALAIAPGGGVAVNGAERLWGVDCNFVCLSELCCHDVALFFGYRYADLSESLAINATVGAATTTDRFATRNQFNGGQVGIRAGKQFGSIFFGVQAEGAAGTNHEFVDIVGTTTAGGVSTVGGTFAKASNIGRFGQSRFAYLAQGEAKLGWQINRNFMIYVGYDYLGWYRALRPADQIDRHILAPQPPSLSQSYFWAQGGNLGFELRY
jgi:hypothetical protein